METATISANLIERMRGIERETEALFLSLADTIPSLVREMRHSLEESERSIACMVGGGIAGCLDNSDFARLISETREHVLKGAAELDAVAAEDSTLFAQLNAEVEQLGEIKAAIMAIQNDSEEMELVSLNAMTVALKAGNAGRAFSYITDELRRLSARTIALGERVSAGGDQLQAAFTSLERALSEAAQAQSDLFAVFRGRVEGSFTELKGAAERTIDVLTRLRDDSAALRQPIDGMMEAVQLQDILRQSIDHIILALEAGDVDAASPLESHSLDDLAFLRKIPPLAEELVTDVARQIDDGAARFRSLVERARDRLDALERERTSFVAEMDGSTTHDGRSLEAMFGAANGALRELLGDLQHNAQRKEALVRRSAAITQDVRQLEGQFRSFGSIVTRFRSIDIASRIEVAKSEALRQSGASAEEMTALTRRIAADVDTALSTTHTFIDSTSSVIEAHEEHFIRESRLITDYRTDLEARYTVLTAAKEQVSTVIRGFSLFTDAFVSLFDRTEASAQRLTDLATEVRGLNGTLGELGRQIDAAYEAALARDGRESWEIESSRLRSIIDRFTIFTHKRAAGEEAGLEAVGAEAGEITLF